MRLHIAHNAVYRYEPPAAGVIQVLRLTPRNHEGQYVVRWRIDVSSDARLATHEDAFGNITHVFTADGPLNELKVEVAGEVETQNTNGVVLGAVERFPPSLFLRDTALTAADPSICQFAQDIRTASGGQNDGQSGGQALAELHALLDQLHDAIACDAAPASEPTGAAEAFARKRGTVRDLTHIFIGAARNLGIPARYVSGYCRDERIARQEAAHAWAEAHVEGLGWVGFDPSLGSCPIDAHVRVAGGLDALGAAAVRGTRYGSGAETVEIAVKVGQ